MTPIVSVSTLAARWNVTPRYVRFLCAKGTIKAKQLGRAWIIEDSARLSVPPRTNGKRAWTIHKDGNAYKVLFQGDTVATFGNKLEAQSYIETHTL